jgi:hypothetical protein
MTETVYFKRAEQCERESPATAGARRRVSLKILVGRRCRLQPLGGGDGPRTAAEEFELQVLLHAHSSSPRRARREAGLVLRCVPSMALMQEVEVLCEPW